MDDPETPRTRAASLTFVLYGPIQPDALCRAVRAAQQILDETGIPHEVLVAAEESPFDRERISEALPADPRVRWVSARPGIVGAIQSAGAGLRTDWRQVVREFADRLSAWWSRVQFAGRGPADGGRSWLPGLFLAILAAFLLYPDNQPLLDPDEGRQAEVAREMLAHDDLLLPRMLGQPYYEKPPLQYWLTAGAYRAFGVRARSARLVPAVAAWLAVLLTFAWGRRALGQGPALLGALVLCLSWGFVALGRTVVLDSLLTACVLGAWFAAYQAVRGPALRRAWWVLAAAACGLGILAKGPVAVVLTAVPVWAFQRLTDGAARPRWQPWAAFFGLALAVAAPWYIAMAVYHPDYLSHFLWKANVVRFVTPYDHPRPFWFYVPVLFAGTFPWSLLWPALGYFLVSRKPRLAALRTPALGYCVLLLGWCLLFFSLSGCKSPPYIAPAMAPLALAVGACLDAVLFRRLALSGRCLQYARHRLARPATLCVLGLSAGCYLAAGLLGWQKWGWVLGQVGVTMVLAAAWRLLGRRAGPRLAWGACAAVTLLFVVCAGRDLKRSYASRHSPAAMARLVRRLPESPRCPVVCFGRMWPSAYFYLRREEVDFIPQEDPQALADYLRQQPEVLILVESGPLLDQVLRGVPAWLEARVRLPREAGQVALVTVRKQEPK